MISNVALLSLPLLAAGARHGHHHAHHHAHVARSQAVGNCPTDMVTVTKTAYVTVTVPVAPGVSSAAPSSSSVVQVTSSASPAPSTHPAPSTPAQPPASSTVPQPPAKDKPADNSGTTFNALQAIGNTAIVKNSCTYPVYIWSAGHASCDGVQVQGQLIEPKGTYTETLRRCKDGGMSLKISKTQSAARPLQFEYAIWQDGSENVSYDISYLDCMKNDKGQKDLNDCAGHDGGIQAIGGAEHAPTYQCPANLWCDKQAYVVAEFDYKPGAPVGAVKVDKGIAFELCACSG